jgi:hypothetical protein
MSLPYNMPLFNEPTVEQYGSHMVLSNVSRPIKKKYYNIDTRFRDDYSLSTVSDCIITLPQRITHVKSMRVTNAEIPFSFYNVSASLKNNTILFTDNLGGETVYTIPDGFYTPSTISTYFTAHAINAYVSFQVVNGNFSQLVLTPADGVTSMTVQFAVDATGSFDKLELKNKLGWLLGFRQSQATFTTSLSSEAMMDFNGSRYLFLVLDEFTQNTNDNTFVSPLYRSIVNKNIIARANTSLFSLSNYTFGNGVFTPNDKTGTLLSDKRTYNNVDLQKFRVEWVNEFGNVVQFNGLDFSFCLEIEYE